MRNRASDSVKSQDLHHGRRLASMALFVGLTAGLAAMTGCGGSDDPASTATSSGSAGLTTPLAFVNNRDDKTMSVIALNGANNPVITTMPASNFENNALGDMITSKEEWIFVNLGVGNKVATIDPLSGAVPIHEANLPTGERPVHIYADTTDKEVIWSMNDGNATTGVDNINCATSGGGSVTILHNSHLGPGGNPPHVEKTICLLGAGHKVAAFSQPTATTPGIPKRVFISSTTAGEIAVIDNEPASAQFRTLIHRIDLCTDAGEAAQTPPQPACDVNANQSNVLNTPNKSNPHGIRWSQAAGKVYSIQEGYKTIVEIDPVSYAMTRTLDLAGTPYTAFGITPDGRFLLLRGTDLATDSAHIIGRLAVVDVTAGSPLTIIPVAALTDVVPSTFKFAPDGKRLYMVAANTATGNGAQAAAQKKDRLFVFDPSGFPAAISPLAEVTLPAATGHSFDVVVKGAGAASDVVVSNGTVGTPGSVTIINASTNAAGASISVGLNPGAVMAYVNGAVSSGNVATAEAVRPSGGEAGLPERLDDHGMPE
ncbi:hypothetical protein DNFV4_00932 [Nitrospira tepida]|uniref:Uncharacterized protein n=1 Tax=Nitrospira tepida TaxID=2973512 RepID=A0AA86MX48_9BACT|nr:hypothetical protein [Nitrospira tepida]CAI4030504.1 hypothetical protein DNFV4_00932 [Nitrospira tepida]